jgi:hypothetical protein
LTSDRSISIVPLRRPGSENGISLETIVLRGNTFGPRLDSVARNHREGRVPRAVSRWRPLLFEVVPSDFDWILLLVIIEITL